MNLLQHRRQCARVSQSLRLGIFLYFSLPPFAGNVCDSLHEHGYWQADLVLCLLRINTREARSVVAKLVGHPIVVCPPCLRHARRAPPPRKLARHELRVTWIKPDAPDYLSGDLALRISRLRPGMLLAQYRARGGRRRDLRVALARGLVRVESGEVLHA